MKVAIIGGGIIGLSSAYYLQKSGCEVTVFDKGDFLDNCSYGNAGYICPSHFIPLATPGVVKQGLKWMFNSRSPFYVQPRLDFDLISWAWKFQRHATKKNVETAAVPLRDIALLSQEEYKKWAINSAFNFNYSHKGLLEIFQTEEAAAHAQHTLAKAHELGLLDTQILNKEQLQAMEPGVEINALGALYFACDAHCYPNKLMSGLIAELKSAGVKLMPNAELKAVNKTHNKIQSLITTAGVFETDEVVMATGSWGRETASLVGINLPLMPGRGYSVTLTDSPYKLNHPSVLVEGRVATTPLANNAIRFGGTMEITSHKTPPRLNRVEGILAAIKRYYPSFDVAMPSKENIWYGYRPCSMDGLPYIGRVSKIKNLTLATGHSMLGLSLGAGTGKLVSEIVCNKPLSMDIQPFLPERC
jgi:D-amino-acid dehydrogenase